MYGTLCAGTHQLYLLSPWQLLGELVQSCGEIYKDFVVGTVYEQPNRGACLYQTRVIPCKRLLMLRLPCSLETHVVWSSSETIEELAYPILCFGRPTHNAFLKTRLRGLNFWLGIFVCHTFVAELAAIVGHSVRSVAMLQ